MKCAACALQTSSGLKREAAQAIDLEEVMRPWANQRQEEMLQPGAGIVGAYHLLPLLSILEGHQNVVGQDTTM